MVVVGALRRVGKESWGRSTRNLVTAMAINGDAEEDSSDGDEERQSNDCVTISERNRSGRRDIPPGSHQGTIAPWLS
jgi:hypothetical protein